MTTTLRILVGLVGLGLLAASLLMALQTSRFVSTATRQDGTVTRLNAGGSHPQISFATPDGTGVSYPQGGLIAGMSVGQAVQVLYDPADPAGSARLDSFGSLWGESLAVFVCGAVLCGLAGLSVFVPVGFYFKGR